MTKSDKIKKTIGHKIVKFRLNPSWDSAGYKHYDPEIHLDNGIVIRFLTSE
ncbi:unnamed protein product, partial [marine sediment metagenome]